MNQENIVLRCVMFSFFEDDEEDEEVKYRKIKMENYVESIIPNYSDRQFQSHFRMTPTTFEDLLTKCNNLDRANNLRSTGGNPELSVEKQMLITLWYLANIESYRGVADRFGVSTSTAWQCVVKMCHKLLDVNRVWNVITFSNRPEHYGGRIQGFSRRGGFPNVVGAIDGSHIPIKAPHDNPISYINRKGFHSILLQGVCDHKRNFIDCYAGEVGSVHDACMFRRSELATRLENRDFPADVHVVGDSAYPLKMNLMVPFKNNGHLTLVQIHYNKILSKTRIVIENAFALLKGRFRRLKLMEAVRSDLIPLMVMSACFLHNICLNNDDVPLDINIDAELNEERLLHPGAADLVDRFQNNQAIMKRNNIANLLYLMRR